MINYLLELGIIHSALFAVYWLFLKNENQYQTLRGYLIVTVLLALIVPALDLSSTMSSWFGTTQPLTYQLPDAYWLEPLFLTNEPTTTSDTTLPIWQMIYIGISIGLFLRLIWGVVKILSIRQSSQKAHTHNGVVRVSSKIPSSFTFLGSIYINENLQKTDDLNSILLHEQAHASYGHTWDILFLQVFRAAFWWLPTVWVINSEIKKIHEYQADAYATRHIDQSLYSKTLISHTLQANGLSLANSFHDGLILKRIKAMKNQVKRIKKWKLATIGVFILSLTAIIACSKEEEAGSHDLANHPSEVQQAIKDLKLKIGDKQIIATKVNRENFKKVSDSLNGIYPQIFSTNPPVKIQNPDGSVTRFNLWVVGMEWGDYIGRVAEPDENEIYSLVQKPAEYIPGMEAFYEYVASNMNYPEEARKMGVEGRVYIQFVVNEDGSLSDVQAVKGIGAGCDEEAVRVLKSSPEGNWTPGIHLGTPVKQRMVLPIIFKL